MDLRDNGEMKAPSSYAPGPITVWGPRAWYWLHVFAINYNGTDKEKTLQRLVSFIRTLPCHTCREHGTEYLKQNRPDMSSSETFQLWVWNFHNSVNKKLGKPFVTFDEYLQKYTDEICWSNWHSGCKISHYGEPVIAPITNRAIVVDGEQKVSNLYGEHHNHPSSVHPNWGLDSVAGTFHLNGERNGYWYN